MYITPVTQELTYDVKQRRILLVGNFFLNLHFYVYALLRSYVNYMLIYCLQISKMLEGNLQLEQQCQVSSYTAFTNGGRSGYRRI